MPVLPSNPATTSKAMDFITDAMLEIGVLAQGEVPSADEGAACLRKLNRLLDTMNARRALIYNVNFTTYTLLTNHQPHTIGPGGDFNVPTRPERIVSAQLVLNTSNPAVNLPLNLRDDAWWANNRVPSLAASVPTDLYYSPDFALGKIFLWPIPTTAYQLQIETWEPFTLLKSTTDPIAYPPGYWDAIVYTLAITLAPSFHAELHPALVAAQKAAMAAVINNNLESPRIDIRGAGVPSKTGGGHFDWRTGGIRNDG